MLHRLRRVRFPPPLEGYGPGRPASSMTALSHSAESDTPSSSSSSSSPLSSSSTPSTPAPTTATNAETSPDAPPVRQKMPLGSDRREPQPAPIAGPSTEQPESRREATLRARKAALSALSLKGSNSSLPDSQPAPRPAREPTLSELAMAAVRSNAPPAAEEPDRPPPTVIHAALARPNPPSPRALLSYVRDRPETYSLQAADALAAYAKRTNDTRVQKGSSDLLSAMRLPAPRVDVARDPPLIELVAEWKALAGVEPNTALLKRFPPAEVHGRDPVLLLRHLHFLYLLKKALPLSTALQLLRYVGAKQAQEMDLLYLHLAYDDASPADILDSFQGLSKAKWTRQTLHLSVLSLLRAHRSANSKPIMSDLRALLSRFESPDRAVHRSPGPETWRHVAQYALESDDEQLAHLAFLGARLENAGDRDRDARARSRTSTIYAPLTRDSANEHALAGPAPKFLHLGRHLTRWERLLHRLQRRGWAVRTDRVDEDSPVPLLMQRWEWVGREGEAAAQQADTLETQEAPLNEFRPVDINVLAQAVPDAEVKEHKAGRRRRERKGRKEKEEKETDEEEEE